MSTPASHRPLWLCVAAGYVALAALLFVGSPAPSLPPLEAPAPQRPCPGESAAEPAPAPIETRKAVVEVSDRRADGTFFNPAHPGTHEPAAKVRRVFTTPSGLDYSGQTSPIHVRPDSQD